MNIALTFDIERDIPNILDTYFGVKVGLLKILEILDDYSIKGTFFCTGDVVKKFPKHIKLIEQKRHEIACHSLNHERINQLTFKECQESIYQNKKIIEGICQNSEIIGFRAPYLHPPRFLFTILHNLGFKYDSSIKSRNKIKFKKQNYYQIQEMHPLDISLRFPLGHSLLKKLILIKKLSILYLHPLEVIDVKSLLLKQKNKLNIFKDFSFRPDRWINTGDTFINRITNFIEEAFSKKAEFVTLKKVIIKKVC